MKKKRLIPVLLLKDGWLVQSKSFSKYQNLGNPYTAVKRLSEWAADELIYLDISKGDAHDLRRDDLNIENKSKFLDIIEEVSKVSFMPITVGGRIRSLEDIEERLRRGADKIALNTHALAVPSFIELAAKRFGSQCIVIGIDVKRDASGVYRVMTGGGKAPTPYTPEEWANRVEGLGAGEILVSSIDRDGMKTGYDLELLDRICGNARVPIIALGGAGEWEHFEEAFNKTSVDAVAAANIFHYVDQSVYLAKKYLYDNGLPVRKPFIAKLI